MRSVAAQSRVPGQFAPKPAQSLQNFIGARLTPNKQGSIILYQVDLIALLQAEFPHKAGGQPHRERISPFGNLHLLLTILG